MEKIIFGLVGTIASGKGTAAKYLDEVWGAESFRYSTIIRDILDRLYQPQTRENMQDLSTMLRKKFGEELFSGVISQDAAKSPADLIVVDGIRRFTDIAAFKDNPNFHLIRIQVSLETAFERIKKRSENPDDQTQTFEEFKAAQEAEADKEIEEVAATATIVIDNNGTEGELYEQLDKLVNKLRHGQNNGQN